MYKDTWLNISDNKIGICEKGICTAFGYLIIIGYRHAYAINIHRECLSQSCAKRLEAGAFTMTSHWKGSITVGPNNLCSVTRHFLLLFSVSHVIFIRILFRHVTCYNIFIYVFTLQLYLIRLSCRSASSIKFQRWFYKFYKILTSLSTVFIQVHVGFYNF